MDELKNDKGIIFMDLRLDETGFGTLKIFQCPEEFCYGIDAVLLADYAAGATKSKEQVQNYGSGRRYGYLTVDLIP